MRLNGSGVRLSWVVSGEREVFAESSPACAVSGRHLLPWGAQTRQRGLQASAFPGGCVQVGGRGEGSVVTQASPGTAGKCQPELMKVFWSGSHGAFLLTSFCPAVL